VSDPNACPHCQRPVFREQGAKQKAKTSMLVIHKAGDVEINCGSCGRGVLIPLAPTGSTELRKAVEPRLIVPKA
jgi:hypothetical protein